MDIRERIIVGVAHNIRSQHNVGSLFRTADAVGLKHLFLTGYTPAPKDRFGRVSKDIVKTALGGELHVPWSSHEDVKDVLAKLRHEGYTIVFFECGAVNSQRYDTTDYGKKVACVVGNEVEGIPTTLFQKQDIIAEIPLFGSKESLNVAVAFGVGVYRVRLSH
jgi:tRNA G18 (ribose-2'-O)-methylase SpoU